jgi:hypothetical protein
MSSRARPRSAGSPAPRGSSRGTRSRTSNGTTVSATTSDAVVPMTSCWRDRAGGRACLVHRAFRGGVHIVAYRADLDRHPIEAAATRAAGAARSTAPVAAGSATRGATTSSKLLLARASRKRSAPPAPHPRRCAVDRQIVDHPETGEIVRGQPLDIGPELFQLDRSGDRHGQHAADHGSELQPDRPPHRHAGTPPPRCWTLPHPPRAPQPVERRDGGSSPKRGTRNRVARRARRSTRRRRAGMTMADSPPDPVGMPTMPPSPPGTRGICRRGGRGGRTRASACRCVSAANSTKRVKRRSTEEQIFPSALAVR